MKSRINLYSADYQPVYTFLSFNSVVFAIGFLGILFLIWGSFLIWQSHQLTGVQQVLRAEANQLQNAVDNAQLALKNRKPDPKIITAIEQQKLELSQRQRLLHELSTREDVKNVRFSQVLFDLGASDTEDVWLTHITLNDNQVFLQGYGANASAMPKWLSDLGQTPTFAGIQFKQVSIKRNELGLLFSLNTNLDQPGITGVNQ